MMLVPVSGGTDLARDEERFYVLVPDDLFDAIRGRQELDQAAQQWEAQEIIQTSRRRHPALRGAAAPGLDRVEILGGLVTQVGEFAVSNLCGSM